MVSPDLGHWQVNIRVVCAGALDIYKDVTCCEVVDTGIACILRQMQDEMSADSKKTYAIKACEGPMSANAMEVNALTN